MRRGDIHTVAGGKAYAGKPRPAVIVQDDSFNATESITICAFTTDPTEAQPADRQVEPASDQIVDKRLHHSGILGRSFDQAERMFVAQKVQFRQVRRHPFGQPFGGQCYEPARGCRLRADVPGDGRQIDLRKPYSPPELTRRHVAASGSWPSGQASPRLAP